MENIVHIPYDDEQPFSQRVSPLSYEFQVMHVNSSQKN